MIDDPPPDDWIRMARNAYNPPGATPREEIWREVESRLREMKGREVTVAPSPAGSPRRWWRRVGLLAAASVALLLGLRFGAREPARREAPALSDAPSSAPGVGATSDPDDTSGGNPFRRNAARFAAAGHLNDAEALLSFVSADAHEGRTDREIGLWGRGLLTRTRLMLDSPVANDPAVRAVLLDLEVVLAQVAVLADPELDPVRAREELRLVARGVVDAGVRGRIQAVLPSMSRGLIAAADDD